MKLVTQTMWSKSLSQSSLLTSSASSLASHDSIMLSRVRKRVDSDDFRAGFSRRSSVQPRTKDRPKFESPPGLDKTLESSSTSKSSLSNTKKRNSVLESTARCIKVDVGTQVNFGLGNFSRSESPETRPVERAIEARTGSEDGLGSMVRCLHFAHTYIANRKYFHFF
jgi:hypothetical protein